MTEPPEGEYRLTLVLDRIEDGVTPDYDIYGTTVCPKCEQMVWVDHESGRQLLNPNVWPLCLPCAKEWEAEHPGSFGKPVDHVTDGPCPKCGGVHRP